MGWFPLLMICGVTEQCTQIVPHIEVHSRLSVEVHEYADCIGS
jgi:hypothetical protein